MSSEAGAVIPPNLGRRLADCRARRRWTQKQLADAAGLSVQFLSELENGKRAIGSDALLRLAEALGASLDYLLKGEVAAPQPRRALVIPPELAEAAEEQGWSLSDAADLLRARHIVVARRSRGGEAEERDRPLTKRQWVEFYRRLYRDDPAQ